ncbi:putative holliday junction resolvase [Vibrio phage 142E35-1]|nr:putative holliday junction resolvase [Vibrio phage 142E35-1]
MVTPEAKATVNVRARASDWGMKMFRNNSGMLTNPDTGVPVRFGLGNESAKLNKELKSGDLVGFSEITVTPEMVGKKIAVFTNIEVKSLGFIIKDVYNPKSREYAQNEFNKLVTNANGIAGFASSAQDVDDMVNAWIKKVTE